MSYIAEAISQNICNQCGIKPQKIHFFNCFWSDQELAVQEFNDARVGLEAMHQCKIKVIRMYKPFLDGFKVEYELVGDK